MLQEFHDNVADDPSEAESDGPETNGALDRTEGPTQKMILKELIAFLQAC